MPAVPQETIEAVLRLRAEGLTATKIAEQLGLVSSNAAIGIWTRARKAGLKVVHAERPGLWWNEERVKRLREYAARGLSGSEIAREFGNAISPQSALNKLNALGLSRSAARRAAAPMRPKNLQKVRVCNKLQIPVAGSKPVPPTPVEPSAYLPLVCEPVTLMDLKLDMCRWPIGERDFRFCGAPQLHPSHPNESYCAAHHRLAYSPATDVRRRDVFIPGVGKPPAAKRRAA